MTETRRGWLEAVKVLADRRALTLLCLGFSAGLPFLLVFTTLTAWLRDYGVSRTAIGYFTWIGTLYAIKFLWAPVVDRVPIPILTRALGKRRSWMLVAQLIIAGGLLGMAGSDPATNLTRIALLALLVAFGSATLDVALDAFRIEIARDDEQAALAATYVLGYRVAIITTGAGALYLADYFSWELSYRVMATLMTVGVLTSLLAAEPEHRAIGEVMQDEKRVRDFLLRNRHLSDWRRNFYAHFIGAVVCPLADFFQRYGLQAILILLLVGCYKLSDISMAAMANPLYIDLGFSLSEIASISKIFGVGITIIGGLAGGVLVARYGVMRMLLIGACLVAGTNLLFAWLATVGHSLPALVITITGDNFATGFTATVFIAYLSSLTSRNYSATQYALFSSLMNLPAKLVGGFSGRLADAWGYFEFFLYVAAIGIPAIFLVLYLMRQGHAPDLRSSESQAR